MQPTHTMQTIEIISDDVVRQYYSFLRPRYTEGFPVYSGCMVCPVCCKVWARLTIGDAINDALPTYHQPRAVCCTIHSDCDDRHPVPGSLLDNDTPTSGVDFSMLDCFPDSLVAREFYLTLQAFST